MGKSCQRVLKPLHPSPPYCVRETGTVGRARGGESRKRSDAERNVEILVVFQEKTKGLGENIRRKVLKSSNSQLHETENLLTVPSPGQVSPEGKSRGRHRSASQRYHEGLGFLFIFSLGHSWSGLYCEVVEDSGVTSKHNSIQGQNETISQM